ncbi:MAG TPA: class I SAM-dependent methyltransferase [Terriglobia bacterium]|nr:class I SAM-dependent methyltransferase [Terriglobia bacterium]
MKRVIAGLFALGVLGAALAVGYRIGRHRFETVNSLEHEINYPITFGFVNRQPAIVICSERIVELPFVHHNLPYPYRGRVLDVGCRESEVVFQLASLGYEAWGIDIRPALVSFPGVHYVEDDVCRHPFPAGYFDAAIALSTVEHIGLGGYGNTNPDEQGDLHALQAVNRALNPAGRLILTVPFGQRGQTGWYRVYDHQRLEDLLAQSGFKAETEDFWRAQGIAWIPSPWTEAEQADSLTDETARGVACVLAHPVAGAGGRAPR